VSISPASLIPATAALALGLACGRPTSSPAPAPGDPAATRVLPLEQLFVLEMRGVPPEDTVVTLPTGALRRIILRHGPPDHTVFAELTFPPECFAGPGTPESVTVEIRPRPGVYGIDVTSTVSPGPGAQVRFKYPVSFAAPVAALARYGSPARLERALSIATRLEGGKWRLLPSERPASDNLQAALAASGTYLVVAPR
jgi:hypothetical protein